MKKFTFRVYTTYDREDGFNAWCSATTRKQAEDKMRREYHSVVDLVLIREEKI